MARNEARVHVYCQPGYVVLGFLTVLFSYDVEIPFLTDISGSTPRAIVSNPSNAVSGMGNALDVCTITVIVLYERWK